MVIAEVPASDVPMEALGLQTQRKHAGQKLLQYLRNLVDRLPASVLSQLALSCLFPCRAWLRLNCGTPPRAVPASALTQQAISTPRALVPNERRRRRPPHGRLPARPVTI